MECAPGAELLQPGPTEYIRDKTDLSQSGQERADEPSAEMIINRELTACLSVSLYISQHLCLHIVHFNYSIASDNFKTTAVFYSHF